MRKKIKSFISSLIASSLMLSAIPLSVFAEEDVPAVTALSVSDNVSMEDDPMIVVSLGDSYSSGEGNEPFYGQSKSLSEKVSDPDWLAHRSEDSWPGKIEIPGVNGTMKDYKQPEQTWSNCKWYFKASSGATTADFEKEQIKNVWKNKLNNDQKFQVKIPPQMDVFDEILYGTTDYVTLTIGGNDVDFTGVVVSCAVGSTYLHFNPTGESIEEKLDGLWKNVDNTIENIKDVYRDIVNEAGSQVQIIVAGYPRLFNEDGKGFLISKKEAELVNGKVTAFNNKIKDTIKKCQDEGMNIYFADVEEDFKGHEAYSGIFSSKEWLNNIDINPHKEDLVDFQLRGAKETIASAYSMHPNKDGVLCYAKNVNKEIKKAAKNKKDGVLSGQVIDVSTNYFIADASIEVYDSNQNVVATAKTNNSGNYAVDLSEGIYTIRICKNGYYDNFKDIISVAKGKITFLDSYLIDTTSTVTEVSMKVVDEETNVELPGVKVTVENTTDMKSRVFQTDGNGMFGVTLEVYGLEPQGETADYWLTFEKDGYYKEEMGLTVKKGVWEVILNDITMKKVQKTGTISGKIVQASDRNTPVSDCNIKICDLNGNVISQLTCGTDGLYSADIPAGEYKVCVSAEGYIDFNSYATVVDDEITYLETFLLIPGQPDEIGTACGAVTDSVTAEGIDNVTITIRKDWNNTKYGDIVTTTATDAKGNYSVDLPLGNYTAELSKDGYVTTSINIIVMSGITADQNGVMSLEGLGDKYQIILTWGANPRDLDSHLVGKTSTGGGYHVYFADKVAYENGSTVCDLDHDDVHGNGHETITLDTTSSEPYYYYVHRYAGSGTIPSSGAQVKVLKGNATVAVYNVPANGGSGDYWNVFSIVDGKLIANNTITDRPITSNVSTVGLFDAEYDILPEKPYAPNDDEEMTDVSDETETDTDASNETNSDTNVFDETNTNTDVSDESNTDIDVSDEINTDTDVSDETNTDTDGFKETSTDTNEV